jgi:DNA-directed RNA polymerase specialized sigma24 family protein
MTAPEDERRRTLGSPELRRVLVDYVRKRVGPADVDDVVQIVLLDALAATSAPSAPDELKKWVLGVARHKIADHHRRGSREKPAELPDLEAEPPPVEEQQLVEWATREAGKAGKDGERTLGWMAREGEGDKLEHIAAEEKLPAATVRQRVSRMRRFMRERWLAEVAAVALLGGVAFVVWRVLRAPDPIAEREIPTVTPETPREPPALELRRSGLALCAERRFGECEARLDEAKRLDPAGESTPEVQRAREDIARSKVIPSAAPAPAPSVSAPPSPSATTPRPTATPTPFVTAKPTSFIPPSKTPVKPQPKLPPSFDKKSSGGSGSGFGKGKGSLSLD